LRNALRAVKVGSKVVYATCSVSWEENDGIVDKMLEIVRKRKGGAEWGVRVELGREGNGIRDDKVLERMSEETRFGRIVLPDGAGGGGWGPLCFCVMTKVTV
jgi:16S rRNA C967 or C1407 C5-methylase (RsmB/RsmF family)